MTEIAVTINDERKAGLLVELLSALDFVIDVHMNGTNDASSADNGFHDPRQPLMEKEVAAFERLHPTLIEHYLGEYVALHQGQVVDHDHNQIVLADRIESAYPDHVVLIRQVQPQLPPPLLVRSPRLVRQ